MKSLTRLWQVMASDLGAECGISIDRDHKTVVDRVEHEGIAFLTITLPSFCSDFERSLEQGCVTSDLFLSFKKQGGLPAFLRGYLRLVFLDNGILKDKPSIPAIRAVRQLCLLFKKIELECSDRRKRRAVECFLSCEEDLDYVESQLTDAEYAPVARQAHLLFGDVFDRLNRLVDDFGLNPRHGPGNTADRKVGNQKFAQSVWTERLEEYFPFGEYVLPNWRHISSWPVSFLSPERELPVKVTLVPKTQKTPRVIAQEPTCMQYVQQALMQPLVSLLETDELAKHFVGFSSQDPNRVLARESSVSGELATLDLSEASDRVLNELVTRILSPWPSLLGAVMASRSRFAQLPDGRVIRLRKFASMGSALCFPMEEVVFLAIILSRIAGESGCLSRRELMALSGSVRVFGDDIIVPVDMVQTVMEGLEAFGLKVNREKSFWNGKFRESCGGDFYDGEWVTPVRLKKFLPNSRSDVGSIVSTMELSNRLYEFGYWRTADFVLQSLQSLGVGRQTVPRDSGAIAPWTFQKNIPGGKWDENLQRRVLRTHIARPIFPTNGLDDVAALRKCLAGDFSDPQFRHHLITSGRPVSIRMKTGWVAAGD